jgi:hypothetical protein
VPKTSAKHRQNIGTIGCLKSSDVLLWSQFFTNCVTSTENIGYKPDKNIGKTSEPYRSSCRHIDGLGVSQTRVGHHVGTVGMGGRAVPKTSAKHRQNIGTIGSLKSSDVLLWSQFFTKCVTGTENIGYKPDKNIGKTSEPYRSSRRHIDCVRGFTNPIGSP